MVHVAHGRGGHGGRVGRVGLQGKMSLRKAYANLTQHNVLGAGAKMNKMTLKNKPATGPLMPGTSLEDFDLPMQSVLNLCPHACIQASEQFSVLIHVPNILY